MLEKLKTADQKKLQSITLDRKAGPEKNPDHNTGCWKSRAMKMRLETGYC